MVSLAEPTKGITCYLCLFLCYRKYPHPGPPEEEIQLRHTRLPLSSLHHDGGSRRPAAERNLTSADSINSINCIRSGSSKRIAIIADVSITITSGGRSRHSQ